ncbi:MAG: signal peptidase I [Bacilli bacterium]
MKFIKELIPYAVILLVVVLIRTFIVTPVIVDGSSMEKTLFDGNILLLKKYDKHYDRFDVVVFDYNDTKLIKRIIGLPGETVKYVDGLLYINDKVIDDKFSNITANFSLSKLGLDVIPEGYYFVMGDNRNKSSDSRVIGLISKDVINGSTSFKLWPTGFIK